MMMLIVLSLLCCVCDVYTSKEIYLKLFDETGFPNQGDIPLLNRKVFKGNRVTIREHPYVVSIRRRVSHYCMGTLLLNNLVVTVAHPLINVPISELSVVAGENYADRGITLLTVVVVILHEDFDQYTLANDIALLRIYEDLTYKGSIKSIGLVSPKLSLADGRALVTGWGRCDRTGWELCLPRTSEYYPGEKMDPMLRTISFLIEKPNNYCERYKQNDVIIQPGMVCLGTAREEDPVSSCLAVPGAPLVVGARLAALQSWGFGCGYMYDLPLVYTSVQYYHTWLIHNIQILRNITQANMQRLFQATKAAILTKWLRRTRLLLPIQESHPDKHIEPLNVDRELAKLWGTVRDIRDYLYDGIHAKCKAKLYQKLRKKYGKKKRILMYAPLKPLFPPVQSFLSPNDSNVVEAYNATDNDDDDVGDGSQMTGIFDDQKHKDIDSDDSYLDD